MIQLATKAQPVKSLPTTYHLYGLPINSLLPLFGPKDDAATKAEIEIVRGTRRFFSKIRLDAVPVDRSPNISYYSLADGSDYIQFFEIFEFWVSPDGKKIAYRNLKRNFCFEPALGYLQANVLSFALLKMGMEPLHANAIVTDEGAIGFIGDSGYGKSTLAAHFIKSGFSLLTDDVLVIRKVGKSFYACPGTPRIKIFPEMAERFGFPAAGVPMNPDTKKLIFPLSTNQTRSQSVRLKCLYTLNPPDIQDQSKQIRVRKLKKHEAALEIVKAAHNLVVKTSARFARQFLFATELAREIPVYSLSYPRDLKRLPEVQKIILSHS